MISIKLSIIRGKKTWASNNNATVTVRLDCPVCVIRVETGTNEWDQKKVSPILPGCAVAVLLEAQQTSILHHPREVHCDIFHVIENLATLYWCTCEHFNCQIITRKLRPNRQTWTFKVSSEELIVLFHSLNIQGKNMLVLAHWIEFIAKRWVVAHSWKITCLHG